MIKEFFSRKYGKEVTESLLTDSYEVILDNSNSDTKGQKLVKEHLFSLVNGLDVSPNFLNNESEWGMDFSSWLGKFDNQTGKEYMIIGAEPSINKNYQLVYGFGNKLGNSFRETASYHYNRDDIWNYLTNLFIQEGENSADFLAKCYITDLCHIVPKKCGTVRSICDKLNITSKEWNKFRTLLANKYLLEEIELVKPKLLVLHGKVARDFFKNIFGIKYEKIGSIKNTKYSIRKAVWNNIPILAIPHLKGEVRNKLWKCADKERFESAKEIVSNNFI